MFFSDENILEEKEDKSLSKFQKDQLKISKKIQVEEEQALIEKSWQMKGETAASKRPINSVIEEVLTFQHSQRPAPDITAKNPSHPFSYHHLLPLTSLATLIAIIHPGTLTHRKTIQEKICLIGSSPLIFYLLITPNTTPYYTVPLETALPRIFP